MITGYEEVNKLYNKIICMYDAIVCNVCAHFPGFILLIEMLPLGNNYTYDYNIYIYVDTDIVLFECYHSHDWLSDVTTCMCRYIKSLLT